jgi:hypothetical protein
VKKGGVFVCLFVVWQTRDGIGWPPRTWGGCKVQAGVTTSNTSAVINIPMEFSGARDERAWEAYVPECADGVAAAAAAAAAQFEQDSPDQSDLHSLSGASSTDTDDGGSSASPNDDTVMSFQGDPFDDDSTPLSRSPEDYDRHNTGAVVADLAQLACFPEGGGGTHTHPLSSQDLVVLCKQWQATLCRACTPHPCNGTCLRPVHRS